MAIEAPPKPEKKSALFRKSTRKAPAIKNAVVARRLAGQDNSKIARDLGIALNTVKSIVRLTDVDKLMENGRIGTMQRVPEALKTLDVRLEKNSESAALWLLDKCFENQQATGNRMAADVTLNQTLNVLLRPDVANPEKLNSPVITQIENTPEDK